MAAIVAPGITRFAVHGFYGGHEIVNIIDMKMDTTGSAVERASAIHDQAGVILNVWTDIILGHLVSSYSAQSVSWLDLDSLTGSTGERGSTDAETWPQNGTIGDTGSPGNVAIRVNKNTISGRGQRQGRMYLCGMLESWTAASNPNQITEGSVGGFNTGLATFLGDINQSDAGPFSYTSQMVVVHTLGGEYESASVVNSLTVDFRTASQSRRIHR